jgi:hypothetical protein
MKVTDKERRILRDICEPKPNKPGQALSGTVLWLLDDLDEAESQRDAALTKLESVREALEKIRWTTGPVVGPEARDAAKHALAALAESEQSK